MSVYNLIKKRRSIRSFSNKEIPASRIKKILEAARWAPSGLNNQPWRFVIIKGEVLKEKISRYTEYSRVIEEANCLVLVFLDKKGSYNKIKDAQATGACIENMLLTALELGICSCWIGEILNKKIKVNALLDLSSRYELMAAIALGYSDKKPKAKRFSLKKLILKELS